MGDKIVGLVMLSDELKQLKILLQNKDSEFTQKRAQINKEIKRIKAEIEAKLKDEKPAEKEDPVKLYPEDLKKLEASLGVEEKEPEQNKKEPKKENKPVDAKIKEQELNQHLLIN